MKVAVVGVDVPAQNTPDLRERFIPVQNVYENLVSAEKVWIEKILVRGQPVFGMRVITGIKMISDRCCPPVLQGVQQGPTGARFQR